MPAKTPDATLRKIRDMIRAGFTQAEAARACGVSLSVAIQQGMLLERFEGVRRNEAAAAGASKRYAMSAVRRGHEHDENALDLVEVFSTPRTRKQIKQFMGNY
jgi:hypothetical protein